jgi:sulfite exporter TauE/SafE
MSTSLVLTGLVMGLAGGPHCIAMCGAGSGAIGCTSRRMGAFQVGRLVGYAALGAVVASGTGALAWAASNLSWLKPFWAMFHVALFALGVSLVVQGRQPRWLDDGAHRVWHALRLRTPHVDRARWPAVAGLLWALLPCGLLYSALMVASLNARALDGAATMAAFALGSGLSLQIGPTAFRWLRGRGVSAGGGPQIGGAGVATVHLVSARGGPMAAALPGHWGTRLAGAAVAMASMWALGHGFWNEYQRVFC